MKAQRLRQIGLGSIFKFCLCSGFVVALITCAVLLVLGYTVQDLGLELGTFKGVLKAGAGIVGALLLSVACGIGAGIGGTVLAVLYNLFAAAVGGVKIKLDDSD